MQVVDSLNKLLAEELGTYSGGSRDGRFKWQWSEDLFWPAYATGKNVEKVSPGGIVYFEKEYRKDRMSDKLWNQWVVTKWYPPEELSRWKETFPGADYPRNGYYINTNACLDPFRVPTIDDTWHFIKCIRDQTSMDFLSRLRDMERVEEKIETSEHAEVIDEVADYVPAFFNPNPGKRGGHVSVPSLQKEMLIKEN